MEYLLHLLILVGIYVMLSQSLNLSAGFGGMVSLAHAGFYGVGAYTAALLSVHWQTPFLLALPVAMLLAGVLALIVSAIALRTVDDDSFIRTKNVAQTCLRRFTAQIVCVMGRCMSCMHSGTQTILRHTWLKTRLCYIWLFWFFAGSPAFCRDA